MICERERKISDSLDSETILRLLCRLASLLRLRANQLGPISDRDLEEVFVDDTAHHPQQDAWAILQRLPGVTYRSEGEKWLVDADWADALAGLAFGKSIREFLEIRKKDHRIQHPLGSLGTIVAAAYLQDAAMRPQDLVHWLHGKARENDDPTAICDGVQVALQMSEGSVDFNNIRVSGGSLDILDLDTFTPKGIELHSSFIKTVSLGSRNLDKFTISDSLIEVLDGARDSSNLPAFIHNNCVIDEFRFPQTNADIMRESWSLSIRLATVVLRKVFLQSGKGRDLSALQRGIDGRSQAIVPQIIESLTKTGFVTVRRDRAGKEIVHAVRDRASEVRNLLRGLPELTADPWKSIYNDIDGKAAKTS